MKRITITVTFECRDDVSPLLVEWMGRNLCEYAEQEFGNRCEFAPDDEPLASVTDVTVATLRVTDTELATCT